MKEKILELLKCKLTDPETVFEELSPDVGLNLCVHSKLRININSYIRCKKVKTEKNEKIPTLQKQKEIYNSRKLYDTSR